MDANKVSHIIASKANMLPSNSIYELESMLEEVDDEYYLYIITINMKDPFIAFVLSFLFGHFGVDRFYIGQTGIGLLKLMTLGGLGLWSILDLFLIWGATRRKNYEKLIDHIEYYQ